MKQFGKELLAVLVLMFIVLLAKDDPTEYSNGSETL